MTLRWVTAALAAALFASLAGCASDGIQVSTSFDPLATFPAQATFVWNDAANKLPPDDRLRELDLDSLIKQAANDAFAAHGYRRAASGSADYRLAYEVGENIWRGPEGVTSVVSISLVLTSAKSDRRVWVGFARAEVQPSVAREERARRLRGAFDELLEEFPPSGPSR
jgi:hypothetical protein